MERRPDASRGVLGVSAERPYPGPLILRQSSPKVDEVDELVDGVLVRHLFPVQAALRHEAGLHDGDDGDRVLRALWGLSTVEVHLMTATNRGSDFLGHLRLARTHADTAHDLLKSVKLYEQAICFHIAFLSNAVFWEESKETCLPSP